MVYSKLVGATGVLLVETRGTRYAKGDRKKNITSATRRSMGWTEEGRLHSVRVECIRKRREAAFDCGGCSDRDRIFRSFGTKHKAHRHTS